MNKVFRGNLIHLDVVCKQFSLLTILLLHSNKIFSGIATKAYFSSCLIPCYFYFRIPFVAEYEGVILLVLYQMKKILPQGEKVDTQIRRFNRVASLAEFVKEHKDNVIG